MDQNRFNSWEDIFKFCSGSTNKDNYEGNKGENNQSSSKCNNCKPGNGQGEADESARRADSDIPGGFQDIPPQLLLVIGELLGNVMAGNLPFNVQNVVGNWLQLVGQAIEVFNAQQQYYQGGPGRYYNSIYRNVANPFCTSQSDETQKNIVVDKNSESDEKSEKNASINQRNKTGNKPQSFKEINELKVCVKKLCNEIEGLKKEIEELKKKT